MPKAFLMSAGIGSRLKPLTSETPKCLLPIRGKPLLEIWFELLIKHEVDQVLVNTHWLHKKVDQFLQNWKNEKLKVTSSYEPELLGSAGTLLKHKSWISTNEPFYILYGDNLTNVCLSDIYPYHREHGLPFTLGVFKSNTPTNCGIAEIDGNGLVINFVEKPQNPKSNLAAAGIYVTDRRIFDLFPENSYSIRPLDLGYHLLPRLVRNMKVYQIKSVVIDIGTYDSYKLAQEVNI